MATSVNEHGQLEKINRQDVHLLWFGDFWDGPVNGLCLYNNEKCWFETCSEDEDGGRRYVLLKLSAEQLADEEKWHELFRRNVGTHTDFDEAVPQVKPQESHRDFYEPYKTRGKVDYSKNPALGWFET